MATLTGKCKGRIMIGFGLIVDVVKVDRIFSHFGRNHSCLLLLELLLLLLLMLQLLLTK